MTKKIAMLLIVCLLSGSIFAQKVTKDENGNYIAAVSKRGGQPKETGKTYTDKQGKVYPVYTNDKGRLFCIKVSKKTGKEYRYYLIEN
jgi:hypothetical protein